MDWSLIGFFVGERDDRDELTASELKRAESCDVGENGSPVS